MAAGTASVTVLRVRPSKSLGRRIAEHRTLFLLFIPVLVYYVLLRYWPISLAWVISFKELKLGLGIADSPWVGLGNFREIREFEQTNELAFVLGERSFDDWEEYLEEWKRAGGQELLEQVAKQLGAALP